MLAFGLLVPGVCSAGASVGTSIGFGPEVSDNGSTGLRGMPTLDVRADFLVVQIHVLEFLLGVADENVVAGVNLYLPAAEGEVAGPVVGVVQPGLSIDLYGEPFDLNIAAAARFGLEVGSDVHVGVYVVPMLGVSLLEDQPGLLAGGVLEVSVWFP